MPAAGRPLHSTSGPVTSAVTTVTAPAALSPTPMARPRSAVSDRSAISAVEATLAAAQPSPTRKVPSVTDQKAGVKVTSAAPTSAIATPGYITCSRPRRSASRPSGIVKPNMPTVWNMCERAMAVSE